MAMPYTIRKASHFKPGDFPVVVMRMVQQDQVNPHSHQFSELVIITSGIGVHVTEKESWPITAGDVFVVNGNWRHAYRQTEGLGLINILYDSERLAMPTKDLRALPGYHALFMLEPAYRRQRGFRSRLKLSMDELVWMEGIVDALEEELKARRPGFRFMSTALFMRIVGYLSRRYGRLRASDSRSLFRIGQAISHIENHYDKDISLDRLAKIAGMSRRNFLRIFRDAMGDSPIDYLIRLRVSRAIELLRQSDMTITEAAYEVGFKDSNYFTRQFRKVMGMGPRAYLSKSG